MIAIGSMKMENAFSVYKLKIDKIRKSALASLEDVKLNHSLYFNKAELEYLDHVIILFSNADILKSNLKELKRMSTQLCPVPTQTTFVDSAAKKLKSLTTHILESLKYQALRQSFYPKFFNDLGVRTCVYCNSQPALTIRKYEYKQSRYRIAAKFELDHYIAKDDFPFLSICFYNLYPVCANCNKAKGIEEISFDLYGETTNPDYKFLITPESVIRYLMERDSEMLEIKFIDPEKKDEFISVIGSFEDTFRIQGIYEKQHDLAEELIIKAQVYTKAYRASLASSFDRIITNKMLTSRLIIGNYTEIEDTHKRPMSKFTQDIAKQLKII